MIESVMIFALGLLIAGLLMLLFLPAFWRRSTRLARRRLELQMPLSMTEIVAERDQLRAGFAAERRKLEQGSEKLAEALALDRAELGHRASKIITLENQLAAWVADGKLAHERAQMLERQLNEFETERAIIEKVHYDTQGVLDRREDELDALRKRHEALSALSDEQRMTIAGLETRVSGLEIELTDERDVLAALRKQFAEKVSLAQFLERERDQFRSDATAANARREQLGENVAAQQERIEELDTALRAARRERTKLADDVTHLQGRLDEAKALEVRLQQQLRDRADELEKARQRAAESIEAERYSQSVLQGALDTARRENQALRGELAGLRREANLVPRPVEVIPASSQAHQQEASPKGQTDELRAEIAALGSEIIRRSTHKEATGTSQEPDRSGGRSDVAAKVKALQAKLQSVAAAE